ncbi:restriction endonuclease subunit S [Mycoplasma hafezii]|uniref:restriction endonuclease subunit S n=1 Tax=Mycoplasma hafezii TaxID=525886 RepID=UPI003CED14EC
MKQSIDHKIIEKIKQLDSTKVVWLTLKEVFDIRGGQSISTKVSEFYENPTIDVFSLKDIREHGRFLTDSILKVNAMVLGNRKLFPKDSIIISNSATVGEIGYLEKDAWADRRFTNFAIKGYFKEYISPKFVYYLFFILVERIEGRNLNKGGTFNSINLNSFSNELFPIIDLESQKFIVESLDAFTDLTHNLTHELMLRKQQLNTYIKNTFKKIDKNFKLKSYLLDDIVKIVIGKDLVNVQGSLHKDDKYYVPVIGNGKDENMIFGYTDIPYVPNNSISISRVGTLGYVKYFNEPIYPVSRVYSLTQEKTDILDLKFLYFYLKYIHKFEARTGGIPYIATPTVREILLTLPNVEVQKEVSDKLTFLENFIENSLNGLPKIIELEKQRYIYYRNKLLDFSERTEDVL